MRLMKMRAALPLCIAFLAAGALAAPLPAQEFLDRGTFIVTRAGAETAREEFAISVVTGRAEGYRAVSTTRGSGREIQHVLEVERGFAPTSFQQIESAGGQVERRISAQITGTRLSARLSSADGESARELPVRPPVVILGDDQSCAFYFVPRSTEGPRTVSLIRPGNLRPVSATVEHRGTDTISVAGFSVAAHAWVLRAADGDERRFWFTPQGDLLRVERPADGTVSTRSALPGR
jgi:hypothetical protein